MSDAYDIAAFLNSMDEPEMAEEVLNMHHRLEAFACGVDRAASEAKRKAFDDVASQKARLLKALQKIAGGQEMKGEFTHLETVLRYQEIARAAIIAAGEQP